MVTAQPTEFACRNVGLTDPALHRGGGVFGRGAHAVSFCTTRMLRTRLSTSGVPSPVTRSYPGVASATALPPRVTSRKPGSLEPSATAYSSGLRSPSGRPPFSTRYWFITAASPDQIGADCEVPPPTNCLPFKTIFTPVNWSATAETSGVSLRPRSLSGNTARCHGGRSNRADTPPPLPSDSGTSNQACSDCHTPAASVDRVVPPTSVISGSDATESSPMSASLGGDDQSWPPLHSRPARSPLALKAVVPLACAAASADRTGARSAAVISLSQPQPMEKLHTAPGNCRSADAIICAIFS